MSNLRARVLLYPSARLEARPSKADLPIFEDRVTYVALRGGAAITAAFGLFRR